MLAFQDQQVEGCALEKWMEDLKDDAIQAHLLMGQVVGAQQKAAKIGRKAEFGRGDGIAEGEEEERN